TDGYGNLLLVATAPPSLETRARAYSVAPRGELDSSIAPTAARPPGATTYEVSHMLEAPSPQRCRFADFDHHRPPGEKHVWDAARELRERTPVGLVGASRRLL